jgi:hypothetical protein
MRSVKRFNEFITEASGLETLHKLGLASRNEKFINDLEEIIGLCPNLSYVSYPNDRGTSTKIPSSDPSQLFGMVLWMNVKSKMTDEELKEYARLSGKYDFNNRKKFVEKIARRLYGDDYSKEVEDTVKEMIKDQFTAMIRDLRSMDEGDVVFNIWDISQMYPTKGGVRAPRIPSRGSQDYDSSEVLAFLKANPEVGPLISHLQIGADSAERREHARRMSAGEYGSLD